MLKIQMTNTVISQYGYLEEGKVLNDKDFSKAFLIHLVHDAKAAKVIEDISDNVAKGPDVTKIVEPDLEKTVKKGKVKKKYS